MKKFFFSKGILVFIFIILIFISLLFYFASFKSNERGNINIAFNEKYTKLSFLKIFDDIKKDRIFKNYNINLYDGIKNIYKDINQDKIDLAFIPFSFALQLFKENADIKFISVSMINSLYFVSNDENVKEINYNLKDKKIAILKKDETGLSVLKQILESYNLKDGENIEIKYYDSYENIQSDLNNKFVDIGILPYNFYLNLEKDNNSIFIISKLSLEYKKISKYASDIIDYVIIGRSKFIENNKKFVDDFILKYQNSINFLETNYIEASKLAFEFKIEEEEIARNSFSKMGFVNINNKDMKYKIEKFLDDINYFKEDKNKIYKDDNIYYLEYKFLK